MHRKIYLIIAILAIILVFSVIYVNNLKELKADSNNSDITINTTNLKLNQISINQKNTFIAISNNDISGYTRWIPFYFKLETDSALEIDQVEEILNEMITSVEIIKGNETLYKTDSLIWSAYKLDDHSFNLTLVIIPELDSFIENGISKIDYLVLESHNDKETYNLDNYLIESRDTIPENELCICSSPLEATIADKLSVTISYGISSNKTKIQHFELIYPDQFSVVRNYNIESSYKSDATVETYDVEIFLSDDYKKGVFRPFIKVLYDDDKSGYLIPSVPLYLN